MIIIGAKGFAKELLEVCHELGKTENLVFFDNISSDLPHLLYDKFKILKTEEEVKLHFQNVDGFFALGLGKPSLRQSMTELFEGWGGCIKSLISPKSNIGSFGVELGEGATILGNANITNGALIGKGVLMYPNSTITHDCVLGHYVELSPGATVLGNCLIGNNVHIGSNATILPGLRVGSNCIIGAGSVVTRDVSDNMTVKGIPAK
jgi:sugar O-acyltransferase (sialic acid O-acetyltransferase NeuD family)